MASPIRFALQSSLLLGLIGHLTKNSTGKKGNFPMRKVTLIAVLTLVATIPVAAQAASGAKYGVQDPKPCPSARHKEPPSAEQAAQLFTCATEQDTGSVFYLVRNVQIQVSAEPRAFKPADDYGDIDQKKPVYPIRGSFTYFACHALNESDASHTNAGKNCSILEQPNAQGVCYKNTSGEWACKMKDRNLNWDQAKNDNPPPQ
jgi:hypothetical protein